MNSLAGEVEGLDLNHVTLVHHGINSEYTLRDPCNTDNRVINVGHKLPVKSTAVAVLNIQFLDCYFRPM